MTHENAPDPDVTTVGERVAHVLADPGVKRDILTRVNAMGRGAKGALKFVATPSQLSDAIDKYDARQAARGIGEVESIVLAMGRPVLFVQNNTFQTTTLATDTMSQAWRDRLEAARALLEQDIPPVGRINVRNHPTYEWVGTGWLVAPDVVVTNRHVAEVFAARSPRGNGFTFLRNFRDRLMSASIDFRVEHAGDEVNEFALTEVLYIAEPDAPDVALFRLGRDGISPGARLGQPVRLSGQAVTADQRVAVIGYPARDSRIPDPDVLRSIFGDIYDIKRLAPGQVMRVDANIVEHDASTLGGNSGSLVLDLTSGEAVGLHFAGSYRQANYAVPAKVVNDLVRQFTA
jgi:endonuclease G, mitochondrial